MVWFGLVWYGLVWFCWYSLVWGGGQMTSEFIPEEISKCEISHFFFPSENFPCQSGTSPLKTLGLSDI